MAGEVSVRRAACRLDAVTPPEMAGTVYGGHKRCSLRSLASRTPDHLSGLFTPPVGGVVFWLGSFKGCLQRDILDYNGGMVIMKKPRDTQRRKVYTAENRVDKGRKLETVPEMQGYVDQMLRSRWWKMKFPNVTHVLVQDGRARKTAGAVFSLRDPAIKMPRWSRRELFVLHEIAHIARPAGTAAHGRWPFGSARG